jgi:serine/threonine-protein kinase
MTTTLPQPFTVNGRYEITERPLGEGGMGVIYKAYDVVTKRFVALKTLLADADAASIELFEREWAVLARLSHPNIVDILDTGDWVFNGQRRPYFVMPLLPGRTLEEIIKNSSELLNVDRTVDIVSQACRGLQAAHDQNLVHRDIKPSNLFVMDDDTVKIIDFGVVHLADAAHSVSGLKGTPLYMAPEQLEMKPATAHSDIFSLATVCYEALTGRKAFDRPSVTEVAEAVRNYIPPPASDVNPAVNQLVSRTVHKAMAKQPFHRFANAREFGETLQKAFRNEPIERFERSKILPRIERVKKAYTDGDYQFALEILKELESEGHIDPDMAVLHVQIEQALRQKSIRQLLENARIRMEEEEFPLALHKVEDVLALEPDNADAQALKQQIESRRNETQLSQLFGLVREHLDHNLFGSARQGLQEILKIDSSNTEAREMLSSIDQTEQEILKNREEKQRLYESAVDSYRKGDTSVALASLERALVIARRSAKSSSPDLDAQCQSLHDSIRDERDSAQNAYQEGRNFLLQHKVGEALAVCEEFLRKHPGDGRFQALKLDAEEMARDQQTAAIAEVSRRVDVEPDLDQKHKILQEAITAYPDETHFRSALKLNSDRRELINAIVARARQYEDRSQFADAIGELDILRNIYPLFPGLDADVQRLTRRKEEQSRADAKARWTEQIDSHLNAGEYDKALAALPEALEAFPTDNDLLHRHTLAQQGVARNSEANALLKQGQELCAARNFQEGLNSLRKAEQLDPRNRSARAALLSGLVSYARELMPNDWHAAEPLVKEALDLEPTDPVARSLLAVLDDTRRQTAVNIILAGARNYQTDGHLADAMQIIERGLVQYPNDHRLVQFFATLRAQASQPPATPIARPRPVNELSSAPEPISAPETELAPTTQSVEAADPAAPADAPLPNTVPAQAFFAPPTTDIPPREPSENSDGESPGLPSRALVRTPKGTSKAITRPALAELQPFRPPYPSRSTDRDTGLLEELSFKGPVWVVAGLAALVLILSAGVYQIFHKSNPTFRTPGASADARVRRTAADEPSDSAALSHYAVSFESNVPGTRFSEDGQTLDASAQLTAGKHNVEAFHEGYLPENKTFTVDPVAAAPLGVKFDLRPILPVLRVSSSIPHGRMMVDEVEPLDLQSGVASKEDLTIGPHTVKIYDGRRQVFAFAFEARANEMPALLTPLGIQPVAGVVVASLGGSARVYTTAGLRAASALPASALPIPLPPVPVSGLALAGSTANPAHFFIDYGKGKGPQEQSVDSSASPSLTVQLGGAAEATYLDITANASDCQITIDGKQLKRNASGQTPSVALDPGDHPVRLSCPGFEDLEKVAAVRAGEVSPHKLDFVMKPLPTAPAAEPTPQPVRRAQFTLTGAPPETPVFQNQIRIGTVAADGTFTREIDPGTFTWEWRKAGFEPRKETRTAKAGDLIRLDGAMVPVPVSGALLLKVVPENARISVRRESDNAPVNASNNVAVPLPAGSYRVSAQAPEYRERAESIVVAAGKPLTLNWDLEKLPSLTMPVRFFENGDSWVPVTNENGWWIHPGGGYSALRASTGAISLDFLRKKRSRKINILADCEDHANCIVYSLDGHNFTVKVVSGGETVLDDKRTHGMDNDAVFHLLFEMSPDAIVVKNSAGTVLSSVERRNPHGKLVIQDDNPLKIN